MSYPTTAALIGFILAALIVFLIRADKLYLRDALFWLFAAAASFAFGVFPRAIDAVGLLAGVVYPPALLLGLVCVVLTIKALLSEIALTQLRRDVRRINQRVALLESEQ